MAVTDQTAVRELLRAVADALRDEPVVRRVWYVAGPSRYAPDEPLVIFLLILDTDDEDVRTRIVRIVVEAQEPYQDDIGTVIHTVTDAPPEPHDFSDWLPTGAIELPLRDR